MKTCSRCGYERDLSQFYKDKNKKDGLESACKICRNEEWKLRRERANEAVFDYLLDNPCVKCGENDPVVLEFNHLRDKKSDLCHMIMDGESIERIFAEIEKCEVLCANCHRRLTANQFNYYRARRMKEMAKT